MANQNPTAMPRSPWSRYALALLASAFTLGLQLLLVPFLGRTNPYHTAWLGIVFCAWFCGVGPSILAAVVMVEGINYWFLSPLQSFRVSDSRDILGMISFVAFSGVIIAIGERARRTQARLNATRSELESTVARRTAELVQANVKLRELSGNLLQSQDTERRRLARNLHDSIGQLLAAIGMNLGVLRREKISAEGARALKDTEEILDQAIAEIRTLSHLLHPPMLDESGLRSALTLYLEGFSARSKIITDLQIAQDLARFPEEMEIAIFRVVQEALTNAHKHASPKTIMVSIAQADGGLTVQIGDDGKGMAPGALPGLGLTGMQERVRELHGTFDLHSDSRGTRIVARFPSAVPVEVPELRGRALAATAD